MKVWVLGCAGLVGRCLVEFLKTKDVQVIASDKKKVDITCFSELEKMFNQIKPDYIFNCAAYTAVDDAESCRELALAVNGTAPGYLGKLTLSTQCKVIHLSTDYVFSSENHIPFNEEDPTSPINYYGFTKLVGEKNLHKENPNACIVRTSWVFGPGGKNFICSIANLLSSKDELQIAGDQIGRPTYCKDLVEALWDLKDFSGIFHFASSGSASRYDIAIKIFEYMKQNHIPVLCKQIHNVTSKTFITKAPRPLYSVLDTNKYERYVHKVARNWTETLEELFNEPKD